MVLGEKRRRKGGGGTFGRCVSQLEWWGEAAAAHRDVRDPTVESPAFRTAPKERNAPPVSNDAE